MEQLSRGIAPDDRMTMDNFLIKEKLCQSEKISPFHKITLMTFEKLSLPFFKHFTTQM